MTTELVLVLPGLMGQTDWLTTSNLPSIDRLYSKGKKHPLTADTNEILQNLLNIQGSLAKAPLLALAEGINVGQDWWLRADPVQIQTDASAAYLLGNEHLDLSADESQQLIELINDFISQDGLQIEPHDDCQWYLRLRHAPKVSTDDLRDTIRKNIFTFLPQGEQQSYWRKLFTELQMLLHQSPVNQERRQQGLPTVDALWFWGEGQLQDKPQHASWQSLSGDNKFIQGLSNWLDIPIQALNMDSTSFVAGLAPGRHLCYIDSLANSVVYHDQYLWDQALQQIEQNIVNPALIALKQNKLTQLQLYLPTHQHLTLNKRQLNHWWKKTKQIKSE